ncbi:response regulator [Bradyrhizobium sp. ma5]|uniref:response regulator n=1 Tax=Bradyrhizobium sp. ma5 TaxID=3344828 RepID=UPI0035D3F66C
MDGTLPKRVTTVARDLGELAARRDWTTSPLGVPATWPTSLKTTVGLMLRGAAQIVLFWGPEFVALYNDAYAPTIGDKHPRALGRPAKENWSELWDDLEPLLRGVRETGETFSAKDRPFYIERSGYGETVYFDISYSAVPQEDGSVGGVLCIVSETTERVRAQAALKESEANLRELNRTLEQRIADRTRELEQAHAELRQAQKMEAVGQLTGGIAHDFNNLLQGITGNLDLIRRKPKADHVTRWAEAGLKAAERGARLAGQLLAFSRIQKLEIAPIDVTAAVAGFVEMLKPSLGPNIRIRTDLETEGMYAEGDRVQLEMAVLNVALNARDAMPDGGDLTISTRIRSARGDANLAAGDYVELAVTDTGYGMPPEILEHAFEPFFTTKETGKGTGLGLSQVYGTLKQSGGGAEIESTPGRGTTIRLLLRRTDAAPSKVEDAAAPDDHELGKASVLVVDDDPDVRAFLKDSLENLGYRPIICENGPAAIEAVETVSPEVAILDFAMPGMNGAEVARRLRQRLPDLPVIFASGYSETAAVSSARGERSRLLRKPFKIDELQAAVRGLLEP